jgi:hypothetical protein
MTTFANFVCEYRFRLKRIYSISSMREFSMREFSMREFSMREFNMREFSMREFSMKEFSMREFNIIFSSEYLNNRISLICEKRYD